jgi:uncharacterized protein
MIPAMTEAATPPALDAHMPQIRALCELLGVRRLELFGSAAIGQFRPGHSDFDFLVELDADAPGSLAQRWIDLADQLEQLLGTHVDLVSPRAIRNPFFAREVERTRRPVYG